MTGQQAVATIHQAKLVHVCGVEQEKLTAENARLKRWFADESAHAKEAVKEIAKLREALALARPYVAREAGWQRTTIGKDRTAVDALSRVDAALAPADKSKGETDGCT